MLGPAVEPTRSICPEWANTQAAGIGKHFYPATRYESEQPNSSRTNSSIELRYRSPHDHCVQDVPGHLASLPDIDRRCPGTSKTALRHRPPMSQDIPNRSTIALADVPGHPKPLNHCIYINDRDPSRDPWIPHRPRIPARTAPPRPQRRPLTRPHTTIASRAPCRSRSSAQASPASQASIHASTNARTRHGPPG